MARVAFQAAGSLAETATSATLGIVAPATVPGDIMLAFYHANDNEVVTLPSGWALLGTQQNNTADQTVLVAWKKAGTADSGATFNFIKTGTTTLSCGVIVTYRNARIGNPFGGNGISFSKTAVAADAIAFADYTTTTFARVCWVAFYGLGATTMVAPVGDTVDAGAHSNRFEGEATLGVTATICHMQGSLTVPAATGASTMASGSTVDAISVGAIFSIESDDETRGSFNSMGYGVHSAPGGRNPRGETEEVDGVL